MDQYIRLTCDILIGKELIPKGSIHRLFGASAEIDWLGKLVYVYPCEYEYVTNPISASREIEMEYIDW